MRTIRDCVKETGKKLDEDDTLIRAAIRNGWFGLRPNIHTGKFEKVLDQPWAKEPLYHKNGKKRKADDGQDLHYHFGSHRFPRKLCEHRFNLDENGKPILPARFRIEFL